MPALSQARPALASCQRFLAPYCRAAALRYALALRFADVRLAVRANDPQLLAALADVFPDFLDAGGAPDLDMAVVETAPTDLNWSLETQPGAVHGAKESFIDLPDGRIVYKRRTGIWLVFGPAGNAVIGPCRQHPDQVANAVNCRFMERQLADGALLLHAAAVSDGRRGLAIAGSAGAGKSTLALELTRLGAFFVSNDRLLVAATTTGPVMTGLPRMPRANPGTLLANDRLTGLLTAEERLAYAALSGEALRMLERKYDVPIRRCFGPDRFRLRAALDALVLLDWKPDGDPMRADWTCLADRPGLAALLAKDLGPLVLQGPRPANASAILDLFRDQPLLVLSGGVDFARAAALCHNRLTRPDATNAPA